MRYSPLAILANHPQQTVAYMTAGPAGHLNMTFHHSAVHYSTLHYIKSHEISRTCMKIRVFNDDILIYTCIIMHT